MARPPPDSNAPTIGSLRWPVTVLKRHTEPDPATSGLLETFVEPRATRAEVKPIGPMTFYMAVQVDTPVTHKITFRWMDGIDTTNVIMRLRNLPDGTSKTDQFRVRRVMEVDGRERFTSCDCELEKIF